MTPKTLAYLGPRGTFSEEAAVLYDPEAERLPYSSIRDVAMAAESGETDEAVVPIENSIEGSVNMTLDYLIHDATLSIVSEVILPIRQCLIVAEGMRREDIKTVRSHPQALAQCRHYLERNFPKAQLVASLSTAGAIEEALRQKGTTAAIASRRAAQLFGATILEEGIADTPNDTTRFVALGRSKPGPTGNDKTSTCFGFEEDAPGLLYDVLGEFANRSINLAKIESRPTRHELGRYVFLVDMTGHRQEDLMKETLQAVEGHVSTLKIFGSYPKFTAPT